MITENLKRLLTEKCTNELNIRADERWKFAEWFKKSNFYLSFSDTIDDVIAEYERSRRMNDFYLTKKPFDWNDNFSKNALEDFSTIQKSLPYCTCQSIGMALAKLELLEKQGARVKEQK